MITEIAVVQIASDKVPALQETVARLKPVIMAMPGFRAWRQLHSPGESFLVTDVLEWDTMEQALEASDTMMQTPEGQAYGALMEKILVFTHSTQAFQERL